MSNRSYLDLSARNAKELVHNASIKNFWGEQKLAARGQWYTQVQSMEH